MNQASLLITCEHGGNEVPDAYRHLFRGSRGLLRSHRGWDIGALAVARAMANDLRCPLIEATITRLVVDLNRRATSRSVFSEFTKELPRGERARILAELHQPHRDRVRNAVARESARGRRVLHLAIHSFTPVFVGEVRNADFGLLYDPRREIEIDAATAIRRRLQEARSEWRVRRNYPYRGRSDGLTTALRHEFSPSVYTGLEIEINQALFGRGTVEDHVRPVAVALARGARAARNRSPG